MNGNYYLRDAELSLDQNHRVQEGEDGLPIVMPSTARSRWLFYFRQSAAGGLAKIILGYLILHRSQILGNLCLFCYPITQTDELCDLITIAQNSGMFNPIYLIEIQVVTRTFCYRDQQHLLSCNR